jgi:hypothetical protein
MRWGDGGGCHPLVASQKPRVVQRGGGLYKLNSVHSQQERAWFQALEPEMLFYIRRPQEAKN